ncbi:SDR family NAD(P)-dependent oxidoreductase [Brevibacillus sp. SYSU BS000544]|uniref:SDR family NAD(P)-dependent oxidoreductase n=1 Tax=Brevibacillus sp. SYSU BS000544 TaxID=3416443 RepID=UPI003CE47691
MSVQSRIGIVGMACKVPGASTLQEFWELVSTGRDELEPIPTERFDTELYRTCWDIEVKGQLRGGFVEVPKINFRELPIPPDQIRHMHPMEKVGLCIMHEALQEAGIMIGSRLASQGRIYVASNTLGPSPDTDHGPRIRQGEFSRILENVLNRSHADKTNEICEKVSSIHEAMTPPILPDTMTTSASIVAGRIANLYDMQGGHLAIDAGICSSLAAIEEAVLALQQKSCEFALVAGLSPLITAATILDYVGEATFAKQIPSLGEGGVALVLMREDDIGERRVYGFIDGIASAMIPDLTNEQHITNATVFAATQALQQAGTNATQVKMIETRNAGLNFWEKAELQGLSHVYRTNRSEAAIPVTSVVPHIGFLQAASGMIALVKALLTFQNGSGESGFHAISDVGIAPLAFHAILSNSPKRKIPTSASFSEPIAIVGMGAIVPGAKDSSTFWKHTKLGYRSIGDMPKWKWSYDEVIGTSEKLRSYAPSKLAGVVQVPEYDPEAWGLCREEVKRLDGGVIFSILSSVEAAEQAGLIKSNGSKRRISVISGQLPVREVEITRNKLTFFTDYIKRVRSVLVQQNLSNQEIFAIVDGLLTQFKQENRLDYDFLLASSGITNAHYTAKALGLEGQILSVDAACASSLAAVEMGIRRLRANQAEAVIVGGVAHHLVPEYNLSLGILGALSTNGVPPFHQDSNGFVPSEGAGAVVLKRLSDAVRDQDQIYAVVRGIGCSSDGKGTSVLAPSTKGQVRAIEKALWQADIRPDELDHVEAHGTGTRVGDDTEIQTYQTVFGQRHAYTPYSIGAVKSQIGHLSSAAGMVGLIKTAFSLHEKIIPPSNTDARSKRLLPNLATESRIWSSPQDRIRRSGVSSFGMGGINYFLVMEEWQENNKELPALLTQPLLRPLHHQRSDRFTVELIPVSLPKRKALFPLRGKRLLLIQDSTDKWISCKSALEERGATVLTIHQALEITEDVFTANLQKWEQKNGELAGVIDLRMLEERPGIVGFSAEQVASEIDRASDFTYMILRYFYDRFEQAEPLSTCYIAVTCLGGNLGLTDCDEGNVLGAFTQGLLKSLKHELPAVLAKIIDFPAHESTDNVLSLVVQEIEDGNERVEVAYTDRRFVVHHKNANFHEQTPLARKIQKGDVYLFSGGGRGVVLECATALSLLGAKVIVCGRTQIQDPTAPWLELTQIEFAAFEREQMVKQRQTDPSMNLAQFRKTFSRMANERELYQNLRKMKEMGISYEVCDITNASQVKGLINQIMQKHGRLDGIIHGAMVEWSTIIPKKTKEMITNTVNTKVIGLCNLLEATEDIPLRSIVCFGSGAGRFGNKGQSDYSAANALMSALLVAKCRQRKHPVHHVTLNWTAWESVGAAVSDTAITYVLKENGVPFTTPEEGVHWFISELTVGRDKECLNVREDFLRKWPFEGAEADGKEERSLPFRDNGIPVSAGDWPLIDRLVEKTPEKVVVERTVAGQKDRYLEQHCLDQIPILPMVCYLELLAETAAIASPGWSLQQIQDFEVIHAAKLFDARPVVLRAEADVIETNENTRKLYVKALTDVKAKGRILQKDRVNAQANFVFTKQQPNLSKRQFPVVEGASYSSINYSVRRDSLQIGPLFCRGSEYKMNENECMAVAAPPNNRKLFSFTSDPHFQVDPFLVDIAMQIPSSMDSFHTAQVSLPISIGTVLLGRKRGAEEQVKVYGKIMHQEGTDITFDIFVSGENGDTIMELKSFLSRRIDR